MQQLQGKTALVDRRSHPVRRREVYVVGVGGVGYRPCVRRRLPLTRIPDGRTRTSHHRLQAAYSRVARNASCNIDDLQRPSIYSRRGHIAESWRSYHLHIRRLPLK